MSEELKPCPFCGVIDKHLYNHKSNCYLREFAKDMSSGNMDELYNNRPIEDKLQKQIDDLESKLARANMDVAKGLADMAGWKGNLESPKFRKRG